MLDLFGKDGYSKSNKIKHRPYIAKTIKISYSNNNLKF